MHEQSFYAAMTCDPSLLLQGQRMTLRPLQESDCSERYLAWLQDAQVSAWLETRWHEQSIESLTQFVSAMREDPYSILFAMILLDGNQHIGNIKLGPINRNHQCADISYFIGERAYWGRGLASEAIRLVLDWAFSQLRLHRIQAGCYADNRGSARVLEKVGFRPEGVWRQQLRVDTAHPTQWQDHLWFGILAEEWRDICLQSP